MHKHIHTCSHVTTHRLTDKSVSVSKLIVSASQFFVSFETKNFSEISQQVSPL